MTNTTRINGPLRQSPLHVAAETGAPLEVVKEMLEYGAWRLLRDANGKRPLDFALENGHKHLYSVLVSIYEWDIPLPSLLKIQRNFHRLILHMEEKLLRVENHCYLYITGETLHGVTEDGYSVADSRFD